MVSFRLITSLLIGSTVCVATDFDTVNARRRSDIASAPIALSYARNATYQYIPTWISTLQPDGHWLDVNYSTGCAAGETCRRRQLIAQIELLRQSWSILRALSALPKLGRVSTRISLRAMPAHLTCGTRRQRLWTTGFIMITTIQPAWWTEGKNLD